MKYLYDMAKCFGLPLRQEENSLLVRVRNLEDDDECTDGVYLRFAVHDNDYSVAAEVHIHNYLKDQDVLIEDYFYSGIYHPCRDHKAYEIGIDADTFQNPIIPVKNFFDGCKYVKAVNDLYVFSDANFGDAMEYLTYWAVEKKQTHHCSG